jgi:all-trans-retinol dehydrogenase (NAD+)
MSEFNGKTVLITGAASGLGRLLAQKFIHNTLILVDRDIGGLEETKKLIGDRALVHLFECDLSDLASISQLLEKIRKFTIDILVNNAGVIIGKPILELSETDIMKTFMVNTIAPMLLTKEIGRQMVERCSGHIVHISSASALVGVPKLGDYAASKAALLNFDESLRIELHRMNSQVKTTVFCPYYINTGMFSGVKTRFGLLLPILDPQFVVNRLFKAIIRQEKRVILPWFAYTTLLIKILPPSLFDKILAFFGINSSMDEFKGRVRK